MRPTRPTADPGARPRGGFTLVELLIVIGILALLASLALAALYNAQEQAKEDATAGLIQRLGSLVMQKYETYRYRPVNVNISKGATRGQAQQRIVSGRREMVRMEMPDRVTDLLIPAGTLRNAPSGCFDLQRRLSVGFGTQNGWTEKFQGAECLYAIVNGTTLGDGTGADLFQARSIGDVDGDGRPEILDAWGTPVEFIRWAPGFNSPLQNQSVVMSFSISSRVDGSTGGNFTITGTWRGTTRTTQPIGYQATGTQVLAIMQQFVTDLGAQVTNPSNPDYVQVLLTGPTDAEVTALQSADATVPSGPWTVEFFGMTGLSNLTADSSALEPPDDAGGNPLPTPQVKVTSSYVDPLDPFDIYSQGNPPLFPLIISAGKDEVFDIWGLTDKPTAVVGTEPTYSTAAGSEFPPLVNYQSSRVYRGTYPAGWYEKGSPYVHAGGLTMGGAYLNPETAGTGNWRYLGDAADTNGDGDAFDWADNVSNHLINQN